MSVLFLTFTRYNFNKLKRKRSVIKISMIVDEYFLFGLDFFQKRSVYGRIFQPLNERGRAH